MGKKCFIQSVFSGPSLSSNKHKGNFKILIFSATDPRFVYATNMDINLLEIRGKNYDQTQLLSTGDGILSFDLDWYRDWLYWANQTGHIQRTSLTQVKTEVVPTPLPGNAMSFKFFMQTRYFML